MPRSTRKVLFLYHIMEKVGIKFRKKNRCGVTWLSIQDCCRKNYFSRLSISIYLVVFFRNINTCTEIVLVADILHALELGSICKMPENSPVIPVFFNSRS